MKKIVFKCAIDDEKTKNKAMRTVAGVEGVESVSVDMKEGKLTVIGETDPVFLTAKLRKFGFTELLSVGPVKEEKKIGGKEAPAIEYQVRNQHLGVQSMGLNRAIEDEGRTKRIIETVAGFGDFISIEVDVQKGLVIVVGNSVPSSVAMKVRELGYRAKLVSVGIEVHSKAGERGCGCGCLNNMHHLPE